jgi:hypothetical protein
MRTVVDTTLIVIAVPAALIVTVGADIEIATGVPENTYAVDG